MIQKLKNALLSRFKKKSYALNDLDVRLLPYLDYRNGFFIEAGANDGIRQSNTLYFEKHRGWKGLLIEAIPALAEKCRRNRPGCIVENCALVAAAAPAATVEMSYCNLMSLVKGSLDSEEDENRHIQSGLQHLAKSEETYTIAVPAKTLSAVLDKHRLEHIDLLSLDVEGSEACVLKGIDFDRHRIEFMLVEERNREEIEAVIGHLYKPLAILNFEEHYSDILYRRRPVATA